MPWIQIFYIIKGAKVVRIPVPHSRCQNVKLYEYQMHCPRHDMTDVLSISGI